MASSPSSIDSGYGSPGLLAQMQERLGLIQKRKNLVSERRLAEVQEKLRLAEEESLVEEQKRLAEKQERLSSKQRLAEELERLRLEEEERLAEKQKRLKVAEEQRLAELAEEQEKLAKEQKLAEEQERLRLAKKQTLAEELERLAKEETLADEQKRERVAKEQELAKERRLAEEQERKILAEEQSLADEQEGPAEEQQRPADEQEKQRAAEEQEQTLAEELVVELNSCLKRKRDAKEAPTRDQKKRKVDNNAEHYDTEDDDTVDDDMVDIQEQEFYTIENSGEEHLRVIPIAGGKPWNSLLWKESATLDDWKINIGDPVYLRITGKPDGLAKVSEIRQLESESECYFVETAWYYTRDGIEDELQGRRGRITKQRRGHLDRLWPRDASFSYMLSSNRTISIWNALCKKASPEDIAKLCLDKFYVTTNSTNPIREICNAENSEYKWMEDLLHLKAKEGVDPQSDDCFIPDADTISDIQPSDIQPSEPSTSPPLPLREELLHLEGVDPQSNIQPSATPEPSTPHNIQNSAPCSSPPLLPLREEILANGKSPTTLNQTTIEPSCVASPIANDKAVFNYLYKLGIFNPDATTELPSTPYNIDRVPQTISTTSDQTTVELSNTSPSITVALHDIEIKKKVYNLEESVGETPLESELDWNNWIENANLIGCNFQEF